MDGYYLAVWLDKEPGFNLVTVRINNSFERP